MAILPVTVSTATSLKRNVHANGVLVLIDSVTGRTLTLPASSGNGDTYEFYVPTTVTSGSHVVAALTTDIIQGSVAVAGDIAGVTCPTTATTDKITLNGGTTGGVLGSYLKLVDAKSGQWMVSGSLVSTSSEATPFSAT